MLRERLMHHITVEMALKFVLASPAQWSPRSLLICDALIILGELYGGEIILANNICEGRHAFGILHHTRFGNYTSG